MSERIPIATGFFIELKDGRALNRGCEESQVLPMVLFWLRTHEDDNRCHVVKQWVEQKEKQIQEDVQQMVLNVKKEYVNAKVDHAARESKLHDRELIEIIRAEVLKIYGVSP